MTTKEIIEVVKAYEKGKTIECRCIGSKYEDSWVKVEKPIWNFAGFEYRVKKYPTRREVVNKFWEETFGIANRFSGNACPAKDCKDCPFGSEVCTSDQVEKWWNEEYKEVKNDTRRIYA